MKDGIVVKNNVWEERENAAVRVNFEVRELPDKKIHD
jgi:hypothetical protein